MKIMKNKRRAVFKKANAGDIKARFQLARNYLEGRYVDKDEEKAKEIMQVIKDDVINKPLRIKDIGLFNFRGIEELKVKFNEDITVIVGVNGAGKSTILDGVSNILSWFKANLIKESRNGTALREVDINNSVDAEYATLTSRLVLDDSNFDILLTRSKPGKAISRKSSLIEVKALSGIYRFVNTLDQNANLPLVAHYSVARSNEGNRYDFAKVSSKETSEGRWNKLDAYDDVLTDRHDFNEFLSWLVRIDNMARTVNGSKDITDSLLAEIASTENLIKMFEEQDGYDNDAFIHSLKEIISKKIKELKQHKNNNKNDSGSQEYKIFHFIKLAIKKFLPEIDDVNLRYALDDIQLLLEKKGEVISAQQLSQGEKSILSLVGDITRRLVMLNPSKSNPLEGDGIILIDEIDLHLHPAWQQTVILNLQNTFPNIQFIVSTHSPQVLSTVLSDSIRVLKQGSISMDVENEVKSFIYVETPEFQTKGVMSSDILSRIMGIDPIPVTKEAQWITDYLSLIEKDEELNENGLVLWKNIIKHFGESHPVTLECKSALRLKEMKKKIKLKKNGSE